MTPEQAEQTVLQLMKPIFGFARSRTATPQDAEDLAQDITLKLYRALITRHDLAEPEKFAWTIARNALANYYRSRSGFGNLPIHGLADVPAAEDDISAHIEQSEAAQRLHKEIAYLSKTRRRIVIMHYFEGKRQHEIAAALRLPLGTVKWHLSNAKNDLKKGMEIMRTTSVRFDPIKFSMICTSGSAGTGGGNGEYLRSALAQNILYLTAREAMPINDIADALAVSPVYIESEVEFLEENGFMLKQGRGYIANILLDIPTTESNRQMSAMYDKAAEIFAPALFNALAANVTLGNDGVHYGLGEDGTWYSKGESGVWSRRDDDGVWRTLDNGCTNPCDINFALWALIPYVTAQSGKPDIKISFEEAVTYRPDGGANICYCMVDNPDAEPMKYSESLNKLGGPCWNWDDDCLMWFMDTVWGGDRVGNYHPDIANRDISALKAFFSGTLSVDEAARMAERGYISIKHNPDGTTVDALKIVWLTKDASRRLLDLANSIRDTHKEEFDALKSDYIRAALKNTPPHMKKAREFGLQYTFHSDGLLVLYVLNKLIESGKLKPPTEAQRGSLCAVVVAG